jgi:chemotaxis protein MotA
MLVIVGSIVVVVSVIGGYVAMGGKLGVLWQPFEFVIIFGAAAGALVVGSSKQVVTGVIGGLSHALKGAKYGKEDYLELLSMMYAIFKLAKTKGMLALEQHVEKPEESSLFKQFPKFFANKDAVTFFCDYLRMLTLGTDNPHELETLIDEELETKHHEHHEVAHAVQNMADGMPALGIVAAVLGVIKTMGSITEPPEVLGRLIGGALVGTFLGVFLSYGFVGPLANTMKAIFDAEHKYYLCMKAGLLAHLQGYAPAVAVEFARKSLLSHTRPTFYEVEQAVQNAPSA